MKNNLFSWIGALGAVIGFYLLGNYFFEYLTGRFVPLVKQLLTLVGEGYGLI